MKMGARLRNRVYRELNMGKGCEGGGGMYK
jgi:hypothetical protein